MRMHRRERAGMVMVLFTVTVVGLFLLAGLVFDIGTMYFQRRKVQMASDAAAHGGVQEIMRRNTNAVVAAVLDDAKLNGMDDAASDVQVVVNYPPASGSKSGNSEYVEVTVKKTVPSIFMRFLGKTASTVSARTVAGREPDTGPPCILALNPTAAGALTVSGGAVVDGPTCDVVVNSKTPQSITTNGGGCITARSINYVPTASYITNGGYCLSPTPTGTLIPVLDPFRNVPEPKPSDYPTISNHATNVNAGAAVILSPGYYKGGIKFNGGSNATLLPGIYVVDGFQVTSTSTVTGTDVMIYNTGNGMKDIDIHGTATVNLTAPRSGTYQNILFFNTRGAPNTSVYAGTVNGSSQSYYEGVVYFPSVALNYGGSSYTQIHRAMLIADTIKLAGTPDLDITSWAAVGRPPSLWQVAMVD